MRIITGQYKGRHFDIPRSFKARPTTDFAKENIFNVLTGYADFDDALALDLFAGTGSISLELLSRGCRQVVSVEKDRDHAAFIRREAARLGLDAVTAVHANVFDFLPICHEKFDLIFADPPYALEGLETIPDKVLYRDLLHPGGYFILEHGDDHSFRDHPLFKKEKTYGRVHFSFFEK